MSSYPSGKITLGGPAYKKHKYHSIYSMQKLLKTKVVSGFPSHWHKTCNQVLLLDWGRTIGSNEGIFKSKQIVCACYIDLSAIRCG